MSLSEQLYDEGREKFKFKIYKMGMELGGEFSNMGKIWINKEDTGNYHRMWIYQEQRQEGIGKGDALCEL